MEKVEECQKALEKEKISRGMKCTKEDEVKLRQQQKMQMAEKWQRQTAEAEVDMMWHQVLVNDVRRKEHMERIDFQRRQQDMKDRRKAYDEQIATSCKKRQEELKMEREKENRRLEKMRQKMEQDNYDAIKRTKEQQLSNRMNYIEGHTLKMERLKQEKEKERQIDNGTIRTALEELRQENWRQRENMRKLQQEKQVFIENFNRERKTAIQLEEESDKIASQWKQQEEASQDEFLRQLDRDKKMLRDKAANEYRNHIEERNAELERARQERYKTMERVKRTAFIELETKLNNAFDELKNQMEYRESLNAQIRGNQTYMEAEISEVEKKQRPFTRRPEMFKTAMSKVDRSPGRISTDCHSFFLSHALESIHLTFENILKTTPTQYIPSSE